MLRTKNNTQLCSCLMFHEQMYQKHCTSSLSSKWHLICRPLPWVYFCIILTACENIIFCRNKDGEYQNYTYFRAETFQILFVDNVTLYIKARDILSSVKVFTKKNVFRTSSKKNPFPQKIVFFLRFEVFFSVVFITLVLSSQRRSLKSFF